MERRCSHVMLQTLHNRECIRFNLNFVQLHLFNPAQCFSDCHCLRFSQSIIASPLKCFKLPFSSLLMHPKPIFLLFLSMAASTFILRYPVYGVVHLTFGLFGNMFATLGDAFLHSSKKTLALVAAALVEI
nr:hypothetical protein Iba_chr14aCG10510 [Ipomoea batatas]